MPTRRVGVIATVGPDPGLTDEERLERARVRRWQGVLDGSKQKLGRIESQMASASEAKRARLEIVAERVRLDLAKAEAELKVN